MEQGKRIFLAAVSGTEEVDGGPVSYTNSQQTLFLQFHSKGLFLKGLAALICFAAPLQAKVKHKLKDTDREHVISILSDLRYEATMTASESHCHDVAVPVSALLAQRSQTSKVFREVYHVSKAQTALRECQSWTVKRKVEFNCNSRHPRIRKLYSLNFIFLQNCIANKPL